MKKLIFDSFLSFLSKVTSKKVIYTSTTYPMSTNLAVKSKYGFWYCGNVFDQHDIAYGIAYNGAVESFDTDVVIQILRALKKDKDYVVYDVGANTGWYTMVSLSQSSICHLHAFEPVTAHLVCLKETVTLNGKDAQTSIHEVALSNKSGESAILLAGSGSSLETNFLEKNEGTQAVSLKTLDAYISEKKIALPDFIKIDVEGHEYKVLEGAKKTISDAKPVLFIEVAQTLKKLGRTFTNPDYQLLFTFLADLGYESYIVRDEKLKRYDPSLFYDGVNMFLFLQKETHKHIASLLPITN
jgi:FkbM family methyltransferase